MSVEKIAEIKALCIELAVMSCKNCPSEVLETAKKYYDFVMSIS